MPAFAPDQAETIARGMSLEHGWLPDDAPDSAPLNAELAETGRLLAGRKKGFACSVCHAIGDAPPTSAFEAQGVNFRYIHERMRADFYARWIRNPQRYEPGTRMPQYSDAQGKTPLKDYFDGDAQRQFRAIWEYLRAGERIEPPE
jgi:hypothetical protein